MNLKPLPIFLAIIVLSLSCKSKYSRLSFNDLKPVIQTLSDDGSVVIDNNITIYESNGKFLVYDQPVKDFTLNAKIRLNDNATGLIHIHTDHQLNKGYKIVLNNHYKKTETPLTGSLLHIRNTFYPLGDKSKWFNIQIQIRGPQINVHVNEHPIVSYMEPINTLRDQKSNLMLLSEGFIGFEQLSGVGNIEIRDLTLTIPSKNASKVNSLFENEDPVTALHLSDFPVINFHVHLKGGLTIDEATEISAETGVDYGIAANCGLKFPIVNDMGIYEYIEDVKGYPAFTAMQAEGREWVNLFSVEARKEFDYIFTDAMTWTNKDGQRMRLWIPEETFIGDTNDFMEQLTTQIEQIMTEPIDIYVNPTYLPEGLANLYDELWTEERINRIINAIAENNRALEISDRLQWPSMKILKAAKKAGIKFTYGTNNTSNKIGDMEYFLQAVDSLNLTKKDMWMPEM